MKGKFRARAKSWGLNETSTGKEEIVVAFDVLTEGAEEPTVYWRGFFTENTWERTIESLRYMGWQGDDLGQLDGLDANEVELVVEEEPYEGKVYTKVQWVNRLGGLTLKAPLTEDKKRALAARMRGMIRGLDASKGGGQQQRPAAPAGRGAPPPQQQQRAAGGFSRGGALPPEPPPHGDDDIPF